MVAYLKKPEGSEGFHQIVDFLNASHIRYALTTNPTIYVSLIKQFWETATARTLDYGEIELTTTIDGKEVSTAEKDVSTAEPVSIAGAAVTTASVAAVSTASPTRRVSTADDITMANSLVYIRKSASKDKGKGKMDESEPVKTKTKLQQEQERLGYEAAVRLQAELEEEERQRIARSLAQRLQAEEREMYTKAEQARMLVELINQRKRYFAAQRAEERRNKPPTQA
ncbi:hypothetical protein Tco_0770972 [Tanacetum coccineum]|uniref:Xylulose kinase-1 n=1 Tax=Tanacetum coccineum TaxID=301880 RepID=A0ABQ4ZGC2_9ASTR